MLSHMIGKTQPCIHNQPINPGGEGCNIWVTPAQSTLKVLPHLWCILLIQIPSSCSRFQTRQTGIQLFNILGAPTLMPIQSYPIKIMVEELGWSTNNPCMLKKNSSLKREVQSLLQTGGKWRLNWGNWGYMKISGGRVGTAEVTCLSPLRPRFDSRLDLGCKWIWLSIHTRSRRFSPSTLVSSCI